MLLWLPPATVGAVNALNGSERQPMLKTTSRHNLLSILLISVFSQACATLTQGSMQQITVSSTPAGANLVVDGFQRLRTPAVIELSRKESHQLEISLEGYRPETVEIMKVSNSMMGGNILAGGLIGFAVDYSSGAAYRLVPEVVQITLRPVPAELPKNSISSTANEIQVEELETD